MGCDSALGLICELTSETATVGMWITWIHSSTTFGKADFHIPLDTASAPELQIPHEQNEAPEVFSSHVYGGASRVTERSCFNSPTSAPSSSFPEWSWQSLGPKRQTQNWDASQILIFRRWAGLCYLDQQPHLNNVGSCLRRTIKDLFKSQSKLCRLLVLGASIRQHRQTTSLIGSSLTHLVSLFSGSRAESTRSFWWKKAFNDEIFLIRPYDGGKENALDNHRSDCHLAVSVKSHSESWQPCANRCRTTANNR